MTATTFRQYEISPQHDPRNRHTFYAPTLDFAFGLARARWPFALGWTCHSSSDGR